MQSLLENENEADSDEDEDEEVDAEKGNSRPVVVPKGGGGATRVVTVGV